MITTASSAATLKTALSSAKAGDTILLQPGVYSVINLSKVNFTGEVTIASADSGRPAVLTGLEISNSSNLTFDGLEWDTSRGVQAKPFVVSGSKNIRFKDLDVHGSLNSNPQDDRTGLLIRGSDKVTVEGSTFHELQSGVAHLDCTNLSILDNTFDGIQMDGVRGGGSSWVTIAGNSFTNFRPESGDHPDAIQFWTTNTTTSAHDITITDNVFLRGSGARAQGIFLGNEVNLPYDNVTISGNLMAGTMYNGIYVYKATDVTVTNNVVTGFTDQQSYIQVSYADRVLVDGNSSNAFRLSTGVTNIAFTKNVSIAQVADGGAGVYAAWMAGNEDAPVASQTITGTAAAEALVGGAGADTITSGGGADTLTGGAGDDTYVVGAGVKIVEVAGGGVDTVSTGDSFTLPDHVENLILTGRLARHPYGNALDNKISGNSGANRIRGFNGDDTLSGGGGADTLYGGAGSDRLTGGTGADTFVVARGDGAGTIVDFGVGGERDVLDVSDLLAAGSKATVVDLGADTRITFTSGESITLLGVDPSLLTATAVGWVI